MTILKNETLGKQSKHGHLFLEGGGDTCAPGKQSKHGHRFYSGDIINGYDL